jgi:hypothetical protein
MGYYEAYTQSNYDRMQRAIATSRAELAGQRISEQAYRDLLDGQIASMDKQIAAWDKATATIAKSATPTAGAMDAVNASDKLVKAEQASRNARLDAEITMKNLGTYDASKLSVLGNEISGAISGQNLGVAESQVRTALGKQEAAKREALRAARGSDLRMQDAAIAMKDLILDAYRSNSIGLTQASVDSAERLASEWSGVDVVEIDATKHGDAVKKASKDAGRKAMAPLGQLREQVGKLIEAGQGSSAEAESIRAAIEAREGVRGEFLEKRAGIEERLETLEAAPDVTEEAVRARAGELLSPFQERVREEASLREKVFKGGKFAAEQGAKRKQQERFGKMSDAEKILLQQGIRAQSLLSVAGGILPPTRDSIEWDQAQQIFEQVAGGTLEGRQVVAAAQALAEESVGRQAPPSDIKRQRDQILERFMALQIHKRRKDGIDMPVKQTTVEDLEATLLDRVSPSDIQVEEADLFQPVDQEAIGFLQPVAGDDILIEEEPLSTETIYSPPAPVTLTTEYISEEEMKRRLAGGQ